MKRLLPSVLILIYTFLIWKPVLGQTLLGEGTIYFNPPYVTMLDSQPLKVLLQRHDSQALLFFQFAKYIFRDNMKLYMLFLLLGAAFVSISLYFLTKKVTNSIFASSLVVIFFVTNYVGSFEILGLGYYQWFIQRVPNFGLAIIGLIFLIIFLEQRKRRFYYLSFIIYTLAVFLARYTILILPLFVLYIFFHELHAKTKIDKKISRILFTSIPFIFTTYVLFKAQALVTGSVEITSLKQLISILPNVFYQTTYLTIPFIKRLPKYFSITVQEATIPLILLYLLALLFILKRDKTKNKIVSIFSISIFISIPLSVFISIMLNPVFLPFYDTSRYLYYSSIMTSTFWGVVIWQLIKTKKKVFVPIFLVFISFWIIYNKTTLDYNFANWQDKFPPVVNTFNYMKTNITSIPSNSLVIVSPNLGNYGSGMLKYFYGKNNINYMPYDKSLNYKELAPSGTKHIIYLYKSI